MKRSNRLVILVGVLLAVLAFVGIVVVLNNAGTGTGTADQPVTVAVLVAVDDIAIGDPVTPELVEVKQVDPVAVQGTRLADPSQVGGRPSLFNVPRGSQVSAETIGLGGDEIIDLSSALLPGERAVGFQVERVTGMDFLIQPGDHIDVVLAQRINVLQPTSDSAAGDPDAPPRFETIPGLEAAPTVKTVLQNRRVLYVSAQRTAQPEPVEGQEAPAQQAPIENIIVIFAGSDQDAEVVKFVQNDLSIVGDLTAIVRSGEDDEAPDVETSGITLDILVEQFGVPIPNIVQQLQEGEAP
ncbi:MAG TPA: Flp pilus assembly protein CpaB [Nocardioidaceae bacterium]|nr:Flp pilus assembly protein CpaB [Nocardioidaceae bacterium]